MSPPNAYFQAPTTDEWLERIAADDPGSALDDLLYLRSPEGWRVRAFHRRGEVVPGPSPAVRRAGEPWEVRVGAAAGYVPPAEPDSVRVLAAGRDRPVGALLAALGPEPVRLVPSDFASAREAVECADDRVLSVEFDATWHGVREAASLLGSAGNSRVAADGIAGAEQGPATAIACALCSLDAWFEAGRTAGIDATRVAQSVLVRMPAFDAFFPTVAAMRAAREAVDRLATAWGVAPDVRVPLHALAGPFVSVGGDDGLVRATAALAACATGGCDGIELVPPQADVERVVRRYTNLHRVLLHEGRLHEADDPAAGAWYVEQLTGLLGGIAWDALRQVRDRSAITPADVASAVRSSARGLAHG